MVGMTSQEVHCKWMTFTRIGTHFHAGSSHASNKDKYDSSRNRVVRGDHRYVLQKLLQLHLYNHCVKGCTHADCSISHFFVMESSSLQVQRRKYDPQQQQIHHAPWLLPCGRIARPRWEYGRLLCCFMQLLSTCRVPILILLGVVQVLQPSYLSYGNSTHILSDDDLLMDK
jgi:hypothetical protein